jgi:uncharacterized protein (DUF4415 family)
VDRDSVRRIISLQDDAAITAASESDPDALSLTQAQLDPMVPMRIWRGRPRSATRQQLVSIRYSPEVLACFRASGAGWQARMNAVLRDDVQSHSRARDAEGADLDQG